MKLPWKTKKQKLEEKERLEEEKRSKISNFNTKIRNFIAYFFIVMGLLIFTDELAVGIFFIGFGISLLPKLHEYLKKYEKLNNKINLLHFIAIILVAVLTVNLALVDDAMLFLIFLVINIVKI